MTKVEFIYCAQNIAECRAITKPVSGGVKKVNQSFVKNQRKNWSSEFPAELRR